MSATDTEPTSDAMVRGEATEEERRATAAARGAAELTTRDDFTIPARQTWDQSQVAVIKQTVAKDCNAAELALFLEVAARYRLDPFLREIFAAKFNGDNGPVTIFAGRDGLLKAAKDTGRFRHMESHVVREKDTFTKVIDTTQVISDPESGQQLSRLRHLRHEQEGMGTAARGAIVGAYALVWIHGDEEPWYAEATWEDYGQHKSGQKTNWRTSGEGYPEAMMVKVPQSIALRAACGLAGLYGQEEVQKQLDDLEERRSLGGSTGPVAGETPGVTYPEGELGETLRALVDRANELVPGSWRPAKVAMQINGKSEDELEAVAATLRRFIRQRAPQDPLAQENEPPEAEVVEEPEEAMSQGSDTEPPAEEPVSEEAAEPVSQEGDTNVPAPAPPPAQAGGPLQGPLPEGMLRQMAKHDSVRLAVQARVDEIRALGLTDDEESMKGLGFADGDEALAEVERLEKALHEVTNGGPTVQEELEAEPEVAWNAEEYVDLLNAEADLMAALEDASPGQQKRTMESNLKDVRERLEQLNAVRPPDAE